MGVCVQRDRYGGMAEQLLHELRVYSLAEQVRSARMVKAVARVARHAGVTPSNVDKLFWPIGSGYFYDNPQIGFDGKIGRRKKRFIEAAKTAIEQEQRT